MSYKDWFKVPQEVDTKPKPKNNGIILLPTDGSESLYFGSAKEAQDFLGYANINQIYAAIKDGTRLRNKHKPFSQHEDIYFVDYAL